MLLHMNLQEVYCGEEGEASSFQRLELKKQRIPGKRLEQFTLWLVERVWNGGSSCCSSRLFLWLPVFDGSTMSKQKPRNPGPTEGFAVGVGCARHKLKDTERILVPRRKIV